MHIIQPSVSGLPDSVSVERHEGYGRAHHTQDGFQNVHRVHPEPSALRMAGWILGRVFARPEGSPAQVVEIGAEMLKSVPDGVRTTWIGHASVYVQTPTIDLLIDPVFSPRVSPVSWAGPSRQSDLPVAADDLPRVDAVLISHDHYDHLDKASIESLAERFDPVFFVPLGVGQYLHKWGARRIVELDWWQFVEVEGHRFTATPAEHNSGRGLGGRNRTLWSGWYVEQLNSATSRPFRLFYSGDTGYGTHFHLIEERLGPPEVTVLPIGAYEPRWMMAPNHMTPEESLRAFQDVGASGVVVAVHWGTFDLSDESLRDPADRLLSELQGSALADRVFLLPIGGAIAIGQEGSVRRISAPIRAVSGP